MFNRNRVELIGFLAEDPTIGTTGSGTQFARFRIVTNRSWKDRESGDWKEVSEGHSVATFDPYIVERAGKIKKGAYILVEGENRNSRRQNTDGSSNYFYGVFLPNRVGVLRVLDRPTRTDQAGSGHGRDSGYDGGAGHGRDSGYDDDDDEIPF